MFGGDACALYALERSTGMRIEQTRSRGWNSVGYPVEDPMSAVSRYVSRLVPRASRDLLAFFC